MIISTVSFTVAPGKQFEATEYFHQVVRHIKKNEDTEVRILTQLAGPMGHYVLSTQFDTLSEWDKVRTKLANDTQFQKLVTEAGKSGLFVQGSVQTALWQQQT